MKNPLAVSLLALLLSAAALVSALLSPSTADPLAVGQDLPGASPDTELRDQMDALGKEVRELRDRLAMLELRPAPAQRVPVLDGFASLEELDALRDEIRDALAGRNALPEFEAESPAFKEQVADTLAEIRKEEAVEGFRKKQENRLARLDETMPKIEDWLELTPEQSNGMRSALVAQYEREAELLRRWEEGEDGEVLGEQKARDRETHRNELSWFLTPEQLETYLGRTGGK